MKPTKQKIVAPAKWWHHQFRPVPVKDVDDMDRRMGDAIADQIEQTRKANQRHLWDSSRPFGNTKATATGQA